MPIKDIRCDIINGNLACQAMAKCNPLGEMLLKAVSPSMPVTSYIIAPKVFTSYYSLYFELEKLVELENRITMNQHSGRFSITSAQAPSVIEVAAQPKRSIYTTLYGEHQLSTVQAIISKYLVI